MIITLKSYSGKIYQKFKWKEENITHIDIIDMIKPPQPPYEEEFSPELNIRCHFEPILIDIKNRKPVDVYEKVKNKVFVVVFRKFKSLSVRSDDHLDNLPEDLTELCIRGFLDHPLKNLPKGLERLWVTCVHNHPLPDLPKGLTHLCIDDEFYDYPLPDLPKGLEHLYVYESYSHLVPKQTIDFIVHRNK